MLSFLHFIEADYQMFDHYFSLGKSKPMNTDWNEEWTSYEKETSEIISIQDLNDQTEPVLARLDLRFKKRIDNLRILRLKGKVTELKEVQDELRKYVEKEVQSLIESMRQQFMALYKQSVQVNAQHQSQLIRKEVEINQLTRQKQELSQNLSVQQERQRSLKTVSQQNCNKCEQLGVKLAQYQREKRQLKEENQKLQESIFDLEQQVVGVELEVQRRLKETPLSQDQITDWMRKFQQQTQQLQARCQHYQKVCTQSEELEISKKRLERQEADIRSRQDALIDSMAKLHAQQEQNYLRQHQVTQAEQNMSRKIAELRRKEAELIEWQARLSEVRHQTPRAKSPQSTAMSIPKLMIKSREFEPTHHRDYERYDHRQRERREYLRLASPIRHQSPKMSIRNGTTIYRQPNIINQIGGTRGLGPKLQRLRCELKRQIESIR